MSLNYYHGGDNIFSFEHLNHNFFNNKLYEIEPQMGIIDMEKLYNKAIEFKPNLIFFTISDINYKYINIIYYHLYKNKNYINTFI